MESSKLRKSSKYIEQNTTSKSTAVRKVNEDKFNQWWFGAYVHHEHYSEKNIKNIILSPDLWTSHRSDEHITCFHF